MRTEGCFSSHYFWRYFLSNGSLVLLTKNWARLSPLKEHFIPKNVIQLWKESFFLRKIDLKSFRSEKFRALFWNEWNTSFLSQCFQAIQGLYLPFFRIFRCIGQIEMPLSSEFLLIMIYHFLARSITHLTVPVSYPCRPNTRCHNHWAIFWSFLIILGSSWSFWVFLGRHGSLGVVQADSIVHQCRISVLLVVVLLLRVLL